MTDDPAIPQQGATETWQWEPELDHLRAELWRAMRDWIRSDKGANTTLRIQSRLARRAYALGHREGKAEVDTAFDALESALRDCKEAMTTLRGDEKCEHEADLCWCGWKILEDDADTALALAEAVRS